MSEKHTTRIDKWLWSVRIFKTRVQANKACVGRKVKIDGKAVKASKYIVKNDIIQVRKGLVKHIYKVQKVTEKRINAKLAKEFLEDMTPNAEICKQKNAQKQPLQKRIKGQGRPTKKERRIMNKFREKF